MEYISKKTVTTLLACFMFASSTYPQAVQSTQKENVVAQMNYCINSLTNIIHNKSMSVLEHESDQILNNLTMEQIIGLYEINDFRIDLLDAVSSFSITEQERNLLRRMQSIKRDNMKWAALSNALDPTMLLTGTAGVGMGYQLAFQALLTAARSAIEYQTMKGEQNIEELRAMWDLRKQDLKEITDTRKEALKIIFTLYNKYHLSEKDRLTESTANNFSSYISEENATKRARLLEDNRSTYEHIADFYYHLGMAYLDLGKYDKAKLNFTTYLNKYKKAPLLRYDEKSGCIALAILTHEKNLSTWEKEYHVENALKNLPHNSASTLQCAMIYLYELNKPEKALGLIRAGIEDPKASDRSLLYMAAANTLPIAMQYPKLHADICSLFNHENKITLDSYVTYIMNSNRDVWKEISQLITIKDASYRKWYQLWIGKYFNDELRLLLPENIIYDSGDITLYAEKHSTDKVSIKQLQTFYVNGVNIFDIEEVDCFKANKDLKYLYFDVLIPNDVFILKKDIDFTKIKNEEWTRQSEFALSQDDIEDIIEFCKENTPQNHSTELKCEYLDGNKTSIENTKVEISFYGNELKYDVHHSVKQSGVYLRMVLANGIHIMYKFEDGKLNPYLYIINDKVSFANEKYKEEYEYQGEKEPSWWSKIWSSITQFFTNDTEKENQSNKEETKPKASWWSKSKSFIVGLFTEENVKSDTNTENTSDEEKINETTEK